MVFIIINHYITIGCSGKVAKGGKWTSKDPFGFGNYSYTVKIPKTSGINHFQSKSSFNNINFLYNNINKYEIGTGFLLYGITQGSTYAGFQLGVLNNGAQISFQTFGLSSQNYNTAALVFDSSAVCYTFIYLTFLLIFIVKDFHTYTVSYTDVFAVYVDGRFLFQTTTATTVPLCINYSLPFF